MLVSSSDHRASAGGGGAAGGAGAAKKKKNKAKAAANQAPAQSPQFNADIYAAELHLGNLATAQVAPAPAEKPAASDNEAVAERNQIRTMRDYRVSLGSDKLQIMRGEFHRHTEISGDGGRDGPLIDAYRYLIDAANMDWGGCCDHDNGGGREYPWWLQQKMTDAAGQPRNLGEMENADAVGTMGSADCGDMLRMWIKFREENGQKVIDRATFQTFGCETAIAVASLATELIKGKTAAEALAMDGAALSAPLGPLPPMKIHCAQLVEGALRQALSGTPAVSPAAPVAAAPQARSLMDSFGAPNAGEKKVRVILKTEAK